MDFLQVPLVQMSIYLRSTYIGMTEKFHNRSYVSTVFNHVGCAGMAQAVGGNFFSNTGSFQVFCEYIPEPHTRQPPSAPAQKQDIVRIIAHQAVTGIVKIIQISPAGIRSERHQTLLSSLAVHPEYLHLQHNIPGFNSGKFRNPQPAGVPELHDRPVAHGQGIIAGNRLNQPTDLLFRENIRQGTHQFRRIQHIRRITGLLPLRYQKPEQVTQCRQFTGRAPGRDSPAPEPEQVFYYLALPNGIEADFLFLS